MEHLGLSSRGTPATRPPDRRPDANPNGKTATLDIVGCGTVTRRFHLPAVEWLARHGFVHVRYCVDSEFRAASFLASRFRGARPVSVSSRSPFDGGGAEIALIATPPEFHCEWAHSYLQAGANVLVEKPAVLTTGEFDLLSKVAEERQRTVLVGHVRRLFPSVGAARDAVMSGKVGRLRRIEVHEGVRWNWTPRSDFPITSHAGGVLYDIGSHALDLALFICGIDGTAPDAVAAEVVRLERWPEREPCHELRADLVLVTDGLALPVVVRLSRRESLANVIRVQGDSGELLVSVWYGHTALLRTNGSSLKLAGHDRTLHASTYPGCFLAEHLEIWRAWALAEKDSLLALRRFGVLTRLLQRLATGA